MCVGERERESRKVYAVPPCVLGREVDRGSDVEEEREREMDLETERGRVKERDGLRDRETDGERGRV